MMARELLFSVTEKDLIVQTFHSGGPGGQNQNKRETGVRITHKESGAIGEARDSRHQHQNKQSALRRMTEDPKFKIWVQRILFETKNGKTAEQMVKEDMAPENLKIEGVDESGKWVEVQ
jgi:protein subunit release factor B